MEPSDRPTKGERLTLPSLQSRLEASDERCLQRPSLASARPAITDPVALFRHLEATGRFHRDTGFGRIFHPGRISFRENVPADSLHIVIHHNHVAAHVDAVSPLAPGTERPSGYSLRRTVAHNASGMAQDLFRLLRGRQGDHRSRLDCEWVWHHSEATPEAADLLDPTTSAWSVQLEARVSGSLDESRLRTALTEALSREPTEGSPLQVIDCPDDASLEKARAEIYSVALTTTEWPPLRAQLARHPGGDVLMLNVNHAASDGFGALQVLRSIAQTYAAGAAGCDSPPVFLAVGDLPVRPSSAPVPLWIGWYRAVMERVRDLLAPPTRLAPDKGGDEPGYGFHLVQLSADDTLRLADVDPPGTSGNVLLAGIHRAVEDWNGRHGAPARRIGVLVEVNLRPRGWPKATVGNFSVTARVSTSRRDRADRTSTLRVIAAETSRNKRTRTGIALLAALERSGLLELWARQSLIVLQPVTRHHLVDVALLADLGRVEPPSFGVGAGETMEVWFSPPARAPLTLCIGAVTISGRLHLAFRYPHRLFSADSVRRFADCCLSQIRLVTEHHS